MIFTVVRKEPELVPPAKPTPFESKHLSDIDDQEGLRFRPPVIIPYRKNDLMAGINPVNVIKTSLSKALVFYYPFAGRLREVDNRKLVVDCTGEGVLFIEAHARVTLVQIEHELLPPCPVLEEVLFDVPGSSGIIGCPLLLFQVTRLACGGFILGIRFNHTLCDFVGLLQFLNAMVELSRGANTPSVQPVWKRDVFKARDPPIVTCTHQEYDEEGHAYANSEVTVQHALYFSPKSIQSIRNKLSPGLRHTCTTFELLSAYIWKCRTIALQPYPDELVRYSSTISIRYKHGIALPPGFYGNAIFYPAVVTKAKLLIENPLDYALKLVQEVKTKVTEEYVKSATDYLVTKGRPKNVQHLHWCASNNMRPPNLDFGWGKAVFCGIPRGIEISSSFSRIKVRGVTEEENVVVALELPKRASNKLQEEVNKMTVDEQIEHVIYGTDHENVKMTTRSML